MEVEFNTKTAKIKSGTLVKYNNKGLVPCYYGIYLTDINGENPILYDLEEDQYYKYVGSYDIESVIGDVKLVVE
jgi:hypothetical protein